MENSSNGVSIVVEVEKFDGYGGKINLVLMDCHMPVLDGFNATIQIHELCRKLNIKTVPVVAVTASMSADLHDNCLSHGMLGVVTKPYSENDLLFAIVSCMNSTS